MAGPMRNMQKSGAKAKNFKKSWKQLAIFGKRYIAPLIIALLCAIAGSVLAVLGPNKLSSMTKIIEEGLTSGAGKIDLNKIQKIGILLVIIYSLSVIFSYLQGFIMSTITQKMAKQMRSSIAKKINKVPLSYIDGTTYGDVLSRVTNDVDTISHSLSQSTVQLVAGVTLFLGSLIMMFVTNYIMAFAAVGSTLLGFVGMSIIMKHSQKHFVAQQRSLGSLNGHIEEMYSGQTIVSSYNAKGKALGKFQSINKTLYDSAWKSQFLSGLMMPIMSFIGNFGYVVVCVVGAALAVGGSAGIPTIVAFMIYIRLFTQPLSQIAQSMTSLQSTAAASERVFEFLSEPEMSEEKSQAKDEPCVEGNVEFRHVKFGYLKDKEVIHDFSCNVKAGQKVAIVGPTGAGKTTLVNLLMRFYEPWSGDILVDGKPISTMTRGEVHDMFSMVLQDTWVFQGTIKENIVYSKQGVLDEDVVRATKSAGLHHFIKTLPNGYDTVLDENTNISQGQRQLLTIARAMVQNSPMLILDEATSSVDTRTEIAIQKAMDELTKGRTSFVIAHRLSTIKNADLILMLKNGDIVEQGTHEELIAKNGEYAKLYNSQFENPED